MAVNREVCPRPHMRGRGVMGTCQSSQCVHVSVLCAHAHCEWTSLALHPSHNIPWGKMKRCALNLESHPPPGRHPCTCPGLIVRLPLPTCSSTPNCSAHLPPMQDIKSPLLLIPSHLSKIKLIRFQSIYGTTPTHPATTPTHRLVSVHVLVENPSS